MFTTRCPLAHLAVQNSTAHFSPQIHVCDHPVTCLIQNQTPGKTERLAELQQMIIWALCSLAARHSPPPAELSDRRMHLTTPVQKRSAGRSKNIALWL